MRIVIVAVGAENIKANLDTMLPGNTITAYNSIYALYDFVSKSAVRADALVIDDKGVFPHPLTDRNVREYNNAFAVLDDLFHIRYLEAKKVYFLNKTSNANYMEKYKFIQESVRKSRPKNEPRDEMQFYISTQEEHRVTDIKKLLMSFDKMYKSESSRNAIVQKKRGEDLSTSSILEEFETDETIVTRYRDVGRIDRVQVKEAFRNNINPIDIGEPVIEIPKIEYVQDSDEVTEKKIEDKMVLVTGTANSGVTTTTMMLGHSALGFGGKVLLVDLNVDNMGLSYLASEILYPNARKHHTDLLDGEQPKDDDVTILDMTEVYKDSPLYLEREALSSNRLHILTISLPLINAVRDIQFMVINLIERIAHNYRYVIFDVPLKCLENYTVLANRYIDRVVLTNVPYMNKMVSALSELRRSYLPNMRAFKNSKTVALSIGMADRNGMDPISREIYKTYSEHFLGMAIPCTGIFSMQRRDYYKPNIFNEIMSYNGRTVQEYIAYAEVQNLKNKENYAARQTASIKGGYIEYSEDPVRNMTNGSESVESVRKRQTKSPTADDIDLLGHSNLAVLESQTFSDIMEEVITEAALVDEDVI